MPYAFRNQPWKALYLTYITATTVFIRLPFWTLLYLPSSTRPRASWTLAKCLWFRVTRTIIETLTQTGQFMNGPDHHTILPDKRVAGIWVEPANDLVVGDLKHCADVAQVQSIRIPGYWTHKKGSAIPIESEPLPNEKVMYILHGGAYIRCSAHPTDPTAAIQRGLLKNVSSVNRVFAVEYRLAVEKPFDQAHPFPTQLIDALAGYNYLVNKVGFKPEDIIVVGDSAGGNLAQALVRYLVEYKGRGVDGASTPASPGALILLSPWLDLSTAHETLPNGSVERNRCSDYIGSKDGSVPSAKAAFLDPHAPSIAETNPYISPASLHPDFKVTFAGFPRTFILAGTAEVLYDSIVTARNRMISELGEGDGIAEGDGKVRYLDVDDATHDILALTWFEPERTMALKAISRWVTAS